MTPGTRVATLLLVLSSAASFAQDEVAGPVANVSILSGHCWVRKHEEVLKEPAGKGRELHQNDPVMSDDDIRCDGNGRANIKFNRGDGVREFSSNWKTVGNVSGAPHYTPGSVPASRLGENHKPEQQQRVATYEPSGSSADMGNKYTGHQATMSKAAQAKTHKKAAAGEASPY